MSKSFEGYTEQYQQLDHLGDAKCTIANIEQQLAQRDEQIAALRWQFGKALDSYVGNIPTTEMFQGDLEGFMNAFHNTQAVAEDHNAKQQAIGRDAGIRECINHLKGYWDKPNAEAPAIDLEALLSKEPG